MLTKCIGTRSSHGEQLSKIGLYTSPHLRYVRERIQINGQPLSEEQFALYFYEVWDKLEAAARAAGEDPSASSTKPVYFRFLTLMAFHTYLQEGVNTAIIECGIGGAYDSTNVLQKPAVTGITSLGIDHVGVLGSTLPEIAWHKAGIMKPDSRCFSVSSQLDEAKEALDRVAREVPCSLSYVDVEPQLASGQLQLGLAADFQKTNASLALSITQEWLQKAGFGNVDLHDPRLRQGLQDVKWSGRCETRIEGNVTWYIDGGHTMESIKLAGEWYARTRSSQHQEKAKNFLLFNQQTRDANALASALYAVLAQTLHDEHPFSHVIFCTNTTFEKAGFKPDLMSSNTNAADIESLKVQRDLAEVWKNIDHNAAVTVVKTIEEAVKLIRGAAHDADQVTALVTGSLHLVGGFLEVVESGPST